MKRSTRIALAGLAVAAVGGVALWVARDSRRAEPGELAVGQQVQQIVRAEDGSERVWTVEKREYAIEDLPDRVLPAAAPRESAPDERTESARSLDSQALGALDRGDVAGAMQFFERAIEADPDDWLPRSHYGRMLLLATDYERALLHLERAAALRPEDPQMWLDLQTLYERSIQLERAWHARRRAKELSDGQPVEKDDRGFYHFPNGEDLL